MEEDSDEVLLHEDDSDSTVVLDVVSEDLMDEESDEDPRTPIALVDLPALRDEINEVMEETARLDAIVNGVLPEERDLDAIYASLQELWTRRGLLALHKRLKGLAGDLGDEHYGIILRRLNTTENYRRYIHMLTTHPDYLEKLLIALGKMETKAPLFGGPADPGKLPQLLPEVAPAFYKSLILNIHFSDIILMVRRFLDLAPTVEQERAIAILLDHGAFHYGPRRDQPESRCLFLRFFFRLERQEGDIENWRPYLVTVDNEELLLGGNMRMPYEPSTEIQNALEIVLTARERREAMGDAIDVTAPVMLDVWASHQPIGVRPTEYFELDQLFHAHYPFDMFRCDWTIGYLMSHGTLGINNQQVGQALEQIPRETDPPFDIHLGICRIPSSAIPSMVRSCVYVNVYFKLEHDWVPQFPGLSFLSRIDRPNERIPVLLGNLYRGEMVVDEDGTPWPDYAALLRPGEARRATATNYPFDYYVDLGRLSGPMNGDPGRVTNPDDAQVYAERGYRQSRFGKEEFFRRSQAWQRQQYREMKDEYDRLKDEYEEHRETLFAEIEESVRVRKALIERARKRAEAKLQAYRQKLETEHAKLVEDAQRFLEEKNVPLLEMWERMVDLKQTSRKANAAAEEDLARIQLDKLAIQKRKHSRRALDRLAQRALRAAPGPMTPEEQAAVVHERLSQSDAVMKSATDGTVHIMDKYR